MNPGSGYLRPEKFDHPVEHYMSAEAYDEWRAVDNVLNGATNIHDKMLASRSAARIATDITWQGRTPTCSERNARRQLLKKAEKSVAKQLKQIGEAYVQGRSSLLCKLIDKFFKSYHARYVAYVDARKKMKGRLRPHLYAWSSPGLVDTFSLMKESVFHAENEEPVPDGIQGTIGCAGASRSQC